MELTKLEHAKGVLLATVNQVLAVDNLSASQMEGILATILIQVQAQAKLEMLKEVDQLLAKKEKKEGGS